MFWGKWKSEMLLLMTVIDKSEGKIPKEERACALSLVENLIAQSLKKKTFCCSGPPPESFPSTHHCLERSKRGPGANIYEWAARGAEINLITKFCP